jgi:hypothetical protein
MNSAELYRAKSSGCQAGLHPVCHAARAFQFLMGRLAQSEDIVVGVPTAGQSLLENGNLVGQCVNFLPLRTRWNIESTVAQLLVATRESVLQAYEHQAYTLGTLVQKLAPVREGNRLPLTELQFNLERLADRFQLPGLEITVEPNPKAHVNFDIFFNIIGPTPACVSIATTTPTYGMRQRSTVGWSPMRQCCGRSRPTPGNWWVRYRIWLSRSATDSLPRSTVSDFPRIRPCTPHRDPGSNGQRRLHCDAARRR